VIDEVDQQRPAGQLSAQTGEQGMDPAGPGGLLSELTKNVLDTGLDAEVTGHPSVPGTR
jgi:putative transposase